MHVRNAVRTGSLREHIRMVDVGRLDVRRSTHLDVRESDRVEQHAHPRHAMQRLSSPEATVRREEGMKMSTLPKDEVNWTVSRMDLEIWKQWKGFLGSGDSSRRWQYLDDVEHEPAVYAVASPLTHWLEATPVYRVVPGAVERIQLHAPALAVAHYGH